MNSILYSDIKKSNLALSFAGRDEIFIDKPNNTNIKIKYIGSEKFYIKFDPQLTWNLTNESKLINGYKCYKATLEYSKVLTVEKSRKYLVEAWYCPHLPYSFGPNDFQGLPGLILELKNDKITYTIYKIELENKNFKLDRFKINSKIMSENEFLEIIQKLADDRFKNIKRQ